MLTFQHFSATQILREINLLESIRSKTAGFVIFGALNLVHLVNLTFQKVQKFIKKSKAEPLKNDSFCTFRILKVKINFT